MKLINYVGVVTRTGKAEAGHSKIFIKQKIPEIEQNKRVVYSTIGQQATFMDRPKYFRQLVHTRINHGLRKNSKYKCGYY